MKRFLLFIVLVCLTAFFTRTQAQLWKIKRYEATAGFGPSLAFGDIGGFSKTKNILGLRDLSFLQTRYNLNFNLKFRILEDVNARLSVNYGLLHFTDERGSNESRGYEASTSIFEPSVIGEYYFIKNKSESRYSFYKGQGGFLNGILPALDFYAFTGVGGLSYIVKGNAALVNSGKLNTGGFTAVIPVGIGSNLIFSPDFNFGLEIGRRILFTDYLDGYTTQYSGSNDVYYFFNFTVTYKMKTGRNGLPSFR
jgi:hypothetical protein